MSKYISLAAIGAIGTTGAYFLLPNGIETPPPAITANAAVAAEPTLSTAENDAPEGLDDALEDRSARFFYCPNSNPAKLARLAYNMSNLPDQVPTLTKNAGCEPYTDPTSWSGPMLSIINVYGDMHHKAGTGYLAGSFSMGNPAGSGGTGDGVAVWRNARVRTAPAGGALDLSNYINFKDPRDCAVGPYLQSIVDQHMNAGKKAQGPLGHVQINDVLIEESIYHQLEFKQPFNWNGLKASAIKMRFASFGYFDLAINFDEELSKVRGSLKQRGYPVFDDGRDYEVEGDPLSVGATLKATSSGAEYHCYASM